MATEVKRLIKVRVEKGASFKRDGYGKKRQLSDSWRKPRGQHNKQREQKKAKGTLPKPGFGSPIAVRGMHPSGFFEALVSSEKDLEGLNPTTHAVRISGTVGDRKRAGLQEKAIGVGLKVLNAKVVKIPAAERPAEPKKEAKPKKEEKTSVKAKISAAISPKKEKAAAAEEKKAPVKVAKPAEKAPVKKAEKAKPAEAPAKKSAKKPAAEAKKAKPKAAAKQKTAKKSDSGVKKNE